MSSPRELVDKFHRLAEYNAAGHIVNLEQVLATLVQPRAQEPEPGVIEISAVSESGRHGATLTFNTGNWRDLMTVLEAAAHKFGG